MAAVAGSPQPYAQSSRNLSPKPSIKATPSTAPRLDALPRDVLQRVLACLSHEEICRTRPACRALARAAEEVLVRSFDAFGARLLRRLRELRLSPDFSFHTCLICKTLYLIEIEYRLLRAAVGVYVRESSAPFVGGRVLDLLEHALRLSAPPFPMPDEDSQSPRKGSARFSNNLFAPDIVDELSRLVERYILFFESEVEPQLRAPTPLGVKVVDMLDAFTGASSDVELRTQGGWRTLRARYYMPLTGLLFHDEDTGPCSRISVLESEASSLLAALRETARKSGQRYVSALLQRELAARDSRRAAAHYGLFGVRRRCVARDRLVGPSATQAQTQVQAAGALQRERLERRPLRAQPPPEHDAVDTLCLRAALRLRFMLNQRPLEADCLGVPLDEDEARTGLASDPGRWGWDDDGGQGAPPPPSDASPDDDPRADFWFQLEVHRLPEHQPVAINGPVPPLGAVAGPRRRLSFQPARFSRMRLSARRSSAMSVVSGAAPDGDAASEAGALGGFGALSVSLRDVCVRYALPVPPAPCEARLELTYGRLRRTPGSATEAASDSTLASVETAPSPATLDAARALGALEALEAVDAMGVLRAARDGEDSGLAKLRSTLAAAAAVAAASGAKQVGQGAEMGAGAEAAIAAAALHKDSRVDELSIRVSEVLGAEAGLLSRMQHLPHVGNTIATSAGAIHEEWRGD